MTKSDGVTVAEHIPTVTEIREFIAAADRVVGGVDSTVDAFDRFLTAHDEQVRADTLSRIVDEVKAIPCWSDGVHGEFDIDGSHREAVLRAIGESPNPDWFKSAIEQVRAAERERCALLVMNMEDARVLSDWGTVVRKLDARDAIRGAVPAEQKASK